MLKHDDIIDHRLTSTLVSRFMLDLQRVKQCMDAQSSIPSLPSISFNRFNNALGSIGAQLEPGDVWGDGSPDIDDEDYHQNDVIGDMDLDPDVHSPMPLSSAQSSTELGSTSSTSVTDTASMRQAELSPSQDQL